MSFFEFESSLICSCTFLTDKKRSKSATSDDIISLYVFEVRNKNNKVTPVFHTNVALLIHPKTPEKKRFSDGFLTFSGGIEMAHWIEMN